MQPMAGHKGLGLAIVVECLAEALGGNAVPREAKALATGTSPDAGAFLLVINPALAEPSHQGFEAE